MRIISVAWNIYDDRLHEFCQDCTGGGLVIKNVCEYIGRVCESYLFIGQCKMPEMELGNIHIIGTESTSGLGDKCYDWKEKHLIEMSYAFEESLRNIKPDFVNFHGIGELMQRCIKICVSSNIPYAFTEHLYIGLHKRFEGYDRAVSWEKQVYNIPDINIIAVSTGMKRKIMQDFPHIPEENLWVIKNGTDFVPVQNEGNLRLEYGLENKKVLLCVGTILDRKNQCQVVRSFKLLTKLCQENIKIIFCGKDRMSGMLQDSILKNGLEDKLIYAGAVSSAEMKKYYTIADGLIMPSYAEGLSIAALEAIAYGLPVIMFEDSECVEDLNDSKVVCLAKGRSDYSLADAVNEWFLRKWDRDYIINFSKGFSMERMAKNYVEYYNKKITLSK